MAVCPVKMIKLPHFEGFTADNDPTIPTIISGSVKQSPHLQSPDSGSRFLDLVKSHVGHRAHELRDNQASVWCQ